MSSDEHYRLLLIVMIMDLFPIPQRGSGSFSGVSASSFGASFLSNPTRHRTQSIQTYLCERRVLTLLTHSPTNTAFSWLGLTPRLLTGCHLWRLPAYLGAICPDYRPQYKIFGMDPNFSSAKDLQIIQALGAFRHMFRRTSSRVVRIRGLCFMFNFYVMSFSGSRLISLALPSEWYYGDSPGYIDIQPRPSVLVTQFCHIWCLCIYS